MPDHPSWPAELVEKAERALAKWWEDYQPGSSNGEPDECDRTMAQAVLSALSGDLVPREEENGAMPSPTEIDAAFTCLVRWVEDPSAPIWGDDARSRSIRALRFLGLSTHSHAASALIAAADDRETLDRWQEAVTPTPDPYATNLKRTLDEKRAERDEARSQADALADALEEIRDGAKAWVGVAPGITVGWFAAIQKVVDDALASYRSSSSTETEG